MRTINAHPSCNLKFAVDLDNKKLKLFDNIYTETSFTDNLNLSLTDASIDYIVISTPPETHYEIAKLCIEHKKNILVTKPLCLNARDAKNLLELGKKNNCRILIDETFIFSDQVIELKKIINNKKEFGELTFINSNRVNLGLFQQKTNVIWDLGTTATSSNVDAGFSISTYTGTGSNATIGHGLSKAPEMIITKRRDATYDPSWLVYHDRNTAAPETDYPFWYWNFP